jgi:hypothetical protein
MVELYLRGDPHTLELQRSADHTSVSDQKCVGAYHMKLRTCLGSLIGAVRSGHDDGICCVTG